MRIFKNNLFLIIRINEINLLEIIIDLYDNTIRSAFYSLFDLGIIQLGINTTWYRQNENVACSYVNRLREIALRILSHFMRELPVRSVLSKFTDLRISHSILPTK